PSAVKDSCAARTSGSAGRALRGALEEEAASEEEAALECGWAGPTAFSGSWAQPEMSRMAATATADPAERTRRISAEAPGGAKHLERFELSPMHIAISHIKHTMGVPAGDSSLGRTFASPSLASLVSRPAVLRGPNALSRESDLGRCTASELALEDQASPMHLNPPPGQSQTEAGALVLARMRRIQLNEGLEHPFDVGRGYANAGVRHRDHQIAIIVLRGGNRDRTALGCELDRVGEQIQQDLVQLAFVRIERGQIGGDVGHQLDACRLGTLADDCEAAGDEILQIDERFVHVGFPDVGLR